MKKIENVQEDFIRRSFDIPRKYNSDVLLLLSGITKVEAIINKIKITTFYKIMIRTYVNLFKYIKNNMFKMDYEKMENERFLYQIIVIYKKYDKIENIKNILYKNYYFNEYFKKVSSNDNNIIEKEMTKFEKEQKKTEINRNECIRMIDIIQMKHRNELLEIIKSKKMIIRFYVRKIYEEEMEKYKKFKEKYQEIDDFRKEYGWLYDKMYYSKDKKPYFVKIIEKVLQTQQIKDEKVIKIKIQLLTGLLTWKYLYQNGKCPICHYKFLRPDLHVLYACNETKEIHKNKNSEKKIKELKEYTLKNEIIPDYDQKKLNQICYKLKENYKYFKNKYENDDEFNKQLLYNLENEE